MKRRTEKFRISPIAIAQTLASQGGLPSETNPTVEYRSTTPIKDTTRKYTRSSEGVRHLALWQKLISYFFTIGREHPDELVPEIWSVESRLEQHAQTLG